MKLDIIGSVASGKTTLAREISEKYKIPFYEKDNIVWERTLNGDKKRSPEERDRIFILFYWISIQVPDYFGYSDVG